MDATQGDSPLSITANVAGILTFVVAIVAAVYVRLTYLRNSDLEYFQVKTSLSWYKTESAWLAELVRAAGERPDAKFAPEYQMYTFVMDDLLKLEQRLLELVEETEVKAGSPDELNDGRRWTVVPKSWGYTTTVAMAWLPVRAKALELVRQRDALTSRVSFTQMSMISSRIRDLEVRGTERDTKVDRRLRKLEAIIEDQKAEIHRLEDQIYRVMHRNRYGIHYSLSGRRQRFPVIFILFHILTILMPPLLSISLLKEVALLCELEQGFFGWTGAIRLSKRDLLEDSDSRVIFAGSISYVKLSCCLGQNGTDLGVTTV
ncbi:hypothetical protein F5B20DRAFT_585259 [Whalleya microplaca]|nr:hypothetical protein F5B20DRAFT_585259 [Whalleya microplaca]